MRKKYYITTAIDYPNGRPHMGHAYEKVVTDFYARWHRQLGREVYFVTGTDENGQKLLKAADEAKEKIRPYLDHNVESFKKLCSDLRVSNDFFIRTTDQEHHQSAQFIWKKLAEKNLIFRGRYEGHYCLACECFYTETQAQDLKCPAHHTQLETRVEEGYFFKLGQFKDFILDHFEKNPHFVVPSSARKEMISRLQGDELRDLSVSRPNEGHGITIPGDETCVMYTWFDALINYYTATQRSGCNDFWPAQCHVIGKDIVWFHSVIWPAMLKGAEIALPEKIYVHGMVLAEDGKKMSKSLGNVVDPMDVLSRHPVDSFRFYLLKAISSGNDGPFSEKDLVERHNTELGNDLGNLLSRVLKLYLKQYPGQLSGEGIAQEINLTQTHERFSQAVDRYEHSEALEVLWESIRSLNQYVNNTEPWKHKDNHERLKVIVYNCVHALHVFAFHLYPVMPGSEGQMGMAEKIAFFIGADVHHNPASEFGKWNYEMRVPDILFPKREWPLPN